MVHARVTLTFIDDLLETRYAFDAPQTCIVGRAEDCDIQMPGGPWHRSVSRHHCQFDLDPPVLHIRDLGSTNGTLVNGERISGFPPTELRDGDELQVGLTVVRVMIEQGSEVLESVCLPPT